MKVSRCSVAVVGGGPTGLLLAYELGVRNIPTVLVEATVGAGELRSMGLHRPTLSMLDDRGLLEPLAHQAAAIPELGGFSGRFAAIPLTDDSQPTGLGITREMLCRHLSRRLKGLPSLRILRPGTVVAIDVREDTVAIDVETETGTKYFEAQFIVGCDGSHSMVRRAAGISLIGADATMIARLAQCTLISTQALPPVGWTRYSRGWIARLPFNRVMTMQWHDSPYCGDSSSDRPDLAFAASVRCILGDEVTVEDVRGVTQFTNAARVASAFRQGPILLAGDAAHIHFPVGGQGVNLGLQDALNLGWKLAAVSNGPLPVDTLDTYHFERHPVAVDVIDNTLAQTALMEPGKCSAATLHDFFTKIIARSPALRSELAAEISSGRVRYGGGMGCGSGLVGEYMPLSRYTDMRGNAVSAWKHRAAQPLLLLSQQLPDASSVDSSLRHHGVQAIRVNPQKDRPSAVLMRPDGYIAWTSDGSAAMSSRPFHQVLSKVSSGKNPASV